jgi:hypothetical protein
VEVGPLVVLGLMWVVLNALRKAGSKPPNRPGTPPARPPSPTRPDATRTAVVRPKALSGGAARPDATQREGVKLEELLRELGRTLDQARGPAGRAPDRRLPPAEDVEERRSLETTAPEVGSLETEPARGERAVVDQDDEAERVIQRRLAAAETNLTPLTDADHQAFDQRIRQEPADKTATRAYTAKQLRDAVVWREILGPPVSLRGEGE